MENNNGGIVNQPAQPMQQPTQPVQQTQPSQIYPIAPAYQPVQQVGQQFAAAVNPGVQQKVKPPVVKSTLRDLIFGVLYFAFCIFAVDFIFYGGFKLGFTISVFVFYALTVAYLLPTKVKIKPYWAMCGVFALAASVIFALWGDSLVGLVLFIAIILLTALFMCGICSLAQYPAGSYLSAADAFRTAVIVPFAHVSMPFESFMDYTKENKNGKSTIKVLVGIIAAVPVLAIIIPLLIRADAAFESLISKMFGDIGELIAKIIMGAVITPVVFSGVFAMCKRLDKPAAGKKPFNGCIDSIVINSFLCAISAFYIVYLLSQFAYFFSAFSGILPSGYSFTFAEYARRGFFEMSTIAAINLIMLFLALFLQKRTDNKKGRQFTKAISVFICTFTLIIIATAFSKMVFYIGEFGMTRLRIITSVFMLMLSVVFILLIIRLFVSKFPYMKVMVASVCILGLVVGFMDIDRTVAQYNVRAYQSGTLETVDVDTLSMLSYSAVPYMVELLYDDDPNVRKEASEDLGMMYYYRFKDYDDSGIKNYNMSERRAYQLLKDNKHRLKIPVYE